jgi:uncharacterized membrane protein
MIFAHVINALLSFEIRNTTLFQVANFIEGLVAPAFLFASGGSFSIILLKRKDDILYFRKPVLRQISRILQIIFIAYLLHIPYKTLNQCKTIMTNTEYLYFISCDVLQAIGFGLLLLLIFYVIIRNDKVFYNFLFILSIVIIIVTPYVWQYDFMKIFPSEIATLFNKKYGSLFPLFPWLSYVFLGCFMSNLLLQKIRSGNEGDILKKFSIIGSIIIFIGAIVEILSIPTTEYYDFWYTSPNIFMIRFGAVFIFIYLLWLLERKYNYKMKIFGVFGRESLFVYVVHLLVVYGSVLGPGLFNVFGANLGWFEVTVIWIGVCIVMLILAEIWHITKEKLILFARIVLISIFGYFSFYFLTKPF